MDIANYRRYHYAISEGNHFDSQMIFNYDHSALQFIRNTNSDAIFHQNFSITETDSGRFIWQLHRKLHSPNMY